jgi:formate/nitrite transporter FocA (FNT family)
MGPDEPKIILPGGAASDSPEGSRTERGHERDRENERYIPVIIKRSDETRRHPDDVLEKAIEGGLEQLDRPLISLALSSVAAGLMLGFSVMSVGVMTALTLPYDNPLLQKLLTASVYPVGFVVCIMSGTQLFTEHTATAVYPVLDRRSSIASLLRLWVVVLLGNLAGAFASACLLIAADEVIGGKEGYVHIGEHLVAFGTSPLLASSVLAGWLMALGGWLVLATHLGVGQIVCIYLVTFVIGLGGLHHSIAGSVEMFAALIVDPRLSLHQAGEFIATAVLGNLVGGSLFVAVLNYGHIRQTQSE